MTKIMISIYLKCLFLSCLTRIVQSVTQPNVTKNLTVTRAICNFRNECQDVSNATLNYSLKIGSTATSSKRVSIDINTISLNKNKAQNIDVSLLNMSCFIKSRNVSLKASHVFQKSVREIIGKFFNNKSCFLKTFLCSVSIFC